MGLASSHLTRQKGDWGHDTEGLGALCSGKRDPRMRLGLQGARPWWSRVAPGPLDASHQGRGEWEGDSGGHGGKELGRGPKWPSGHRLLAGLPSLEGTQGKALKGSIVSPVLLRFSTPKALSGRAGVLSAKEGGSCVGTHPQPQGPISPPLPPPVLSCLLLHRVTLCRKEAFPVPVLPSWSLRPGGPGVTVV